MIYLVHIGLPHASQCDYFKQNLHGSSLKVCNNNKYTDSIEMIRLCRDMAECRGFTKSDGANGVGKLLCECEGRPGLDSFGTNSKGSVVYKDDMETFKAGQ